MKTELFRFIERKISKYPDANICDTAGTVWSYKEFINKAVEFAEQLTYPKYGIFCRSELWSSLALMACFCAGVTAVPISVEYGEVQKKKIIDTCGLSCILTDTKGYLSEELVGQSIQEMENLSDVALLMCTSGTTGIPRAAMLTERNILANLLDIERYFPLAQKDRILISRSLCHAAVLTGEFLVALSKGANIVFGGTRFDPAKMLILINEYDVTVLCNTPTFFYHFCRFAPRHFVCSTLHMIAVSGECMTEKTASLICNTLPNVSVYHVYGLTEASPRVAWLPPEYFSKKPLSVGNTLASVQIKIVDEKDSKTVLNTDSSSGVVGELWVSGPNIMKGYYNNREATNAVLQDNWLKTGDLAYLDNDGHLVICGRRDDLIILAGLNIYPAEIENRLLEEDAIAEILVQGRMGEEGVKLVFCVVPSDSQVTCEMIFSICRKKLPPQYWPHEIVLKQTLPKSVSGKTKRFSE